MSEYVLRQRGRRTRPNWFLTTILQTETKKILVCHTQGQIARSARLEKVIIAIALVVEQIVVDGGGGIVIRTG